LKIRVLVFAWLLWGSAAVASDWSLTVYSEQYPPYNYIDENGQGKGAAYDLLVLMLNDINREDLKSKIQFVPWARGYHETLVQPNTLLFSIVRNKDRDAMFQWVGPVFETSHALIGSKEIAQSLPSPVSLKDFSNFSIGVVNNDIGELLLQQSNIKFNNLEVVSFPHQAAKMLAQKRIDIWSYGYEPAQFLMKAEGIEEEDYQILYRLQDNSQLYYGFSLQTPKHIVQLFQDSLERMRQKDPDSSLSPIDELALKYQLYNQ